MNQKLTPQDVLSQISLIERMEPGKLSIIRETASGAFYNLQRRENGRNHTEYVPREQVPQVEENLEAYRHFQGLVNDYVDLIAVKTRSERMSGVKTPPAGGRSY